MADQHVMESFLRNPCPIALEPGIQHYPWGDPDFIPRLRGLDNREGKPYAEAWFGAHPRLPATAQVGGAGIDLKELLDRSGERLLGGHVFARFRSLPYLVKILAAARPLSIQVHPNKTQAEEGFERENKPGVELDKPRTYRDDNHKPEILVALVDTWTLRGFRPLEEIADFVEGTPSLRAAIPFEPTAASLRSFYEQFMNLPQERVNAILEPLVEDARAANAKTPLDKDDRRYWLLRTNREFSQDGDFDRGLLSIFLLNLIHLRPGQAVYLPAAVLHAYLDGAGVEVMANSDNVVRGGLTTKHVDIPELLHTVDFRGERAEVIEATPSSENGSIYRTGAEEFEVSRIDVTAATERRSTAHGPEVLVVTALKGCPNVTVTWSHSALDTGVLDTGVLDTGVLDTGVLDTGALGIERGGGCFVPDGISYGLSATGDATVYRTRVPEERSEEERPHGHA